MKLSSPLSSTPSRLPCVVANASTRNGPNSNHNKDRAPHAAPAVTDRLDNAERARLEASDAFQELVALNEKQQKRNRRQKVHFINFSLHRRTFLIRMKISFSYRIPHLKTASLEA